MLDKIQFRELLLRPTLKSIGLWSQAAENLLMGTALVESNLTYLAQIKGIAVSIFEIEPATYADICKRINTNIILYKKCLDTLAMSYLPSDANYLIGNITLAIIICRLKYYFIPQELPPASDYAGLALWHKQYYNTYLGATDISKSEEIFRAVVNEGQSL